MTLPNERYSSLIRTRQFLEMLNRGKFNGTKKELRQEAYRCLKHYPGDLYLDELAYVCPDIIEKKDS